MDVLSVQSASSTYGSAVTSKTSGTTGTATADEIAFAVHGHGSTFTAPSWSNSFSQEYVGPTGAYIWAIASLVISSAATYETTMSWTTARVCGGLIVTFKDGVTDTELVVQDATHAHAAGSPVLAVNNITLVPADAFHSHTALGGGIDPTGIPDIGAYEYHPPSLELEPVNVLVPSDCFHAHTADGASASGAPADALATEFDKAAKTLAYLLEIELGHRIDTDTWTQVTAPNTAVFWTDHLAEGAPSRVKECDRSAHTIAEYAPATSIAACQAAASSWFYDSLTGRLYVHTSGGDSPSTASAYYIASYFWEKLCDRQYEGSRALYFNSYWYLPYLDESSIPDVSLEVSMFSEGGVRQSFGTIGLLNADGYFDSRVAAYVYEGKRAVLKVGVPGSAYSSFKTIWRGWTGNWNWTDERLELSTEDERKIAE